MEQELHPNAGKNDIIEVDGVRYQRLFTKKAKKIVKIC